MALKVTVVVGGQYGSEAKAKACVKVAQLAVAHKQEVISVRCGGPNAGHTIWFGNTKYVCRLIPSGVAVSQAKLFICAGAMIDRALIMREIKELETTIGTKVARRLRIHPDCAIVTDELIMNEKFQELGARIGSTQTGTGATAAARAMRLTNTIGTDPGGLESCIGYEDLYSGLAAGYEGGRHIIVEGTQGFGLSLYHSGCYPYCTSKDTTAASFISEAGISPRAVTDVVMVLRTYPIRVGGNSGPMANEITWDLVRQRSGYPTELVEMTSVTKKVRRVGEFDWDQVAHAVSANMPSQLAIHGMDYLNHADLGVRNKSDLSETSMSFLRKVQRRTGVPVTMAFTGPHQNDMVYFSDGV